MESAGLLRADFCCMLADIMTDVTVQPVRRCVALIVAHDNRHCGMGVRRNLSTDNFCTVCQAAVYLQSAWCCMKRASQYLIGWKNYYLSILLFLFYLIKTAMLLCHFCWAFFTETPQKTLQHLSPSLVQNIHIYKVWLSNREWKIIDQLLYKRIRLSITVCYWCKGKKDMDDQYFALLDTRKSSSLAHLKCCNYFGHVDKLRRVQNRARKIKGL